MSIQDKYKWNAVKLAGQLWARGLNQKTMDLHNDAIEALAIEMGQKGQDREFDSIWTEVVNLEDGYRELQKELNEIKIEFSKMIEDDPYKGNLRNHTGKQGKRKGTKKI